MSLNDWLETADLKNEFEHEFKKSFQEEENKKSSGRAAVIDFSGTASSEIYKNSREFDKRLESCENLLSGKGGKFLIILEDLSRDWVEPLAIRIGVPVSVFALHRADPEDHFLGKARVPLGESPDRHFILAYQQPLPLKIYSKKRGVFEIPTIILFHLGTYTRRRQRIRH